MRRVDFSAAAKAEKQMIDLSVQILQFTKNFSETKPGNYLRKRLLECGVSPVINLGEAMVAKEDKEHMLKISLCMKDLKETIALLKMAARGAVCNEPEDIKSASEKCRDVIVILTQASQD